MRLRTLPEIYRRVRPTFWPSAPPLDAPPTDIELDVARELLASCDPWTRLWYATRYPALFGDLEPDPHPPVLRD